MGAIPQYEPGRSKSSARGSQGRFLKTVREKFLKAYGNPIILDHNGSDEDDECPEIISKIRNPNQNVKGGSPVEQGSSEEVCQEQEQGV